MRAILLLLSLVTSVLGACASSSESPQAAETPEPVVSVTPGPTVADEPVVCERTPQVLPSQTARWELSLLAKLGGNPAALGAALTDARGHGYELTFCAFYLSDFQLLDRAAKAHPATVLGADGQPRIYNLQLVNLDDPSSLTIALAVAPGQYQALRFSVGVSSACNTLDPPNRSWPLSIESEMNWGWTMLHARIEGFRLEPTRTGFMYHLGFPEQFRTLSVVGDIAVPGATARTLELNLDQLFVAPTGSAEPVTEFNVADSFARAGTFALK